MKNSYDFRKRKKEYMTVTLDDGESTVIHVKMPKKKTMESFMQLHETSAAELDIDDVYAVLADTLSENMEGKRITKDMVEDTLDMEDAVDFMRAYAEFIHGIISKKNSESLTIR